MTTSDRNVSSRTDSTDDMNLHRQQAEMLLAQFFLNTVLQHGRQIMDQNRHQRQLHDGSGAAIALTTDEKPIFRRPAYYGWTQGTIAGLTTFGVLFGGMRLSAARRLRNALPPPPRRSFSDLDRSPGAAAPSRFEHVAQTPVSQSSNSSLVVTDDAMSQLQFICIGALSLVVGNLVASSCFDHARFFRSVAKVPLLPGKSYLCHSMCPDLVSQYQRLRQDSNWDSIMEAVQQQSQRQAQGPPTPVRSSWRAPEHTPADLLNDPETEELESFLRLVQNCQRREAYMEELRQQQLVPSDHHGKGDTKVEMEEDPVTVPSPGVPAHFLGVTIHR